MSTGIPGFFELLMLVAVIAVVAVFFRLILKGPRRGGDDGYRQDQPASEAEMLRELHQGLLRMEERIEALCLTERVEGLVEAIKEAHPYETTAIEIHPVRVVIKG